MAIVAIYSYNQNSEGAKALRRMMAIPALKHQNSTFVGRREKTVINWGASELPANVQACNVLNPTARVVVAVNKRSCFELFQREGVPHPEWTTRLDVAREWLNAGFMVFARTQLRAHSGAGIVIMDPEHQDAAWDTRAELYVKYIPKQAEYRVHVMNGQVIDIQRKGLKRELEGRRDVNFKIQNLANGFIYVRNEDRVANPIPEGVTEAALGAMRATQLDFGAVDVIWNRHRRLAYVLEINSAPGLTGQTVNSYADAFRRFY